MNNPINLIAALGANHSLGGFCGVGCDHDEHAAMGSPGFNPGPCELAESHEGPHKHGPHRWVNFRDMAPHVRRQICVCESCQAA